MKTWRQGMVCLMLTHLNKFLLIISIYYEETSSDPLQKLVHQVALETLEMADDDYPQPANLEKLNPVDVGSKNIKGLTENGDSKVRDRQKRDEVEEAKFMMNPKHENAAEEHYVIPIDDYTELHIELWPNDRFLAPDAVSNIYLCTLKTYMLINNL